MFDASATILLSTLAFIESSLSSQKWTPTARRADDVSMVWLPLGNEAVDSAP